MISRRRLLRWLAAAPAGLGLLSGCAPAPPAQAPSPTVPSQAPATTPRSGGREFHGGWPYELPPGGHFNTYLPSAILGGPLTPGGSIYWDLWQPPLAMLRWADDHWIGMLAATWQLVPPDTFRVTLRKGVRWSDGAPVTARDVATTFWVGRLENWIIWRYIDRIDTPDDATVSFHMSRPSSLVERFALRERVRPAVQYATWAERLQALVAAGQTSDTDDWKRLRADFAAFRPSQPLSAGAYRIEPSSISDSQLTLLKNAGGLFADRVNFDRIILYNGEAEQITPLVLAGDLDYATHSFPPATEKAFIDLGFRIIRAPLYTGPALFIQWDKAPQFRDPRLRRAVAHAINRVENARVSLGESARAQQRMTGMSDNLVPLWISETEQVRLNPYAFDLARAEALLQDAGYRRGSDGIWASNGDRLEFEFTAPIDFVGWFAAAQHLTESLTRFGIRVTLRGMQSPQQRVDLTEGRFTLAMRQWGIGNPHPQFSYVQALQTYNTAQPQGGMKYPLKQTTSAGPVDFDALIVAAGEGLDVMAHKTAITQLAVAFNELLPIIPLWERIGNNPVLDSRRVTGWLPPDDPIYRNSHENDSFAILQLLDGTLKPV